MEKILISKCLTGELCRWDGLKLSGDIVERLKGFDVVAICPEMEGGLPCPRARAEIETGGGFDVLDNISKVIDCNGFDVTLNFLKGAQVVLALALEQGIKKAFLNEKSPSCGVKLIYRNGQLIFGTGVTTALLLRHGVEVLSGE